MHQQPRASVIVLSQRDPAMLARCLRALDLTCNDLAALTRGLRPLAALAAPRAQVQDAATGGRATSC